MDLIDEMSERERNELRQELGATCSPKEWKRAWHGELPRRIAQVQAGDVELVELDAVIRDLGRDESVLEAIDAGLRDEKAGRIVSHAVVVAEMKRRAARRKRS
jgi:predicted transcriptional regulator